MNSVLRLHLWGVKTGDHALGTHQGILFYSFDGGCFLCQHGLDLNLGACLQFVPEIPNGFVLVKVVAFELIDLILQHNDDALLRLHWLAMAFHSYLLFLAGSRIMRVFVVVRMGVTILAFSLALRALVGAFFVPANLINHELITRTLLGYNRMNIPPLIPLKQTEVAKYLPQAIELTLTGRVGNGETLNKQQKVIVSKIYKNLNTICKLNIKEVKEVIKAEPAYQQALADLYFDKRINNYMLITSYEKPIEERQKIILQADPISHPNQVCGVEYRIEFTISNIAKKNVMRPVILLVFRLKDGSSLEVYYSLEQFSLLRAKAANAMRQVYGIELRAL